MSIPYRIVALGSGLVAAACLAALILVASLAHAGALASTAIALAIITFIVQLIVYVAQAEQTRRENELTQRLHGELRSSLADLSARAEGTEEIVRKIDDKVLDRALHLTGSGKLETLPPGFTRDLAQNVAELVASQPDVDSGGQILDVNTEFPRKTWGAEEDLRVAGMLTTWPTEAEEIDRFRETLVGLSDHAALVLKNFARDELINRDPESPLAPSWYAARGHFAEELFQRGLVEEYPHTAYGLGLAHLTEKGREAARVFTAEGDPPDTLADVVGEVRTAAARAQAELPDTPDVTSILN